MQNYVIRYVEDLKARIEPTGCSISQALQAVLPTYEKARLLKLRDAALDLVRIVELEIGAHEDREADRRDGPFYTYGEDLADGLTGPFETRAEAEAHVEFCTERGDADPGEVLTKAETDKILARRPGILVLTPEQDRETELP